MFPASSRYHGIDTAKLVTPQGREIVYLRRRFLPGDAESTIFTEHTVNQGDRLDNITARYLGDPEQFWAVCDANGAMRPDDLTAEIGSKVRIPLPRVG